MENYQIPPNVSYPQTAASQVSQPAQNTQSGVPTAAGVNIIIQNPTVAQSPSFPCYPSNYYMQQPVYNMVPNNAYPQAAPVINSVTQPAVPLEAPAPVAAAPIDKDETKADSKSDKKSDKTKNVVQLTDEYIKTLENYLRNPNKDIRVMGAKELSKRFSEDESRRNDKALNSLLNLVLQDKVGEVRFMGLAILNGGMAQGDDTTVKILQNMQSSQSAYGEDALSASQALLKMSGNIVKVPDNSPDKPEKKSEEN